MQITCFSRLSRRSLFAVASIIVSVLFLSGCATTPPVAPQSNLPRSSALALAQQTADSVKGLVFTVAPTGSMKPTLDENSVVTVETVVFAQLRRGDIVIYRSVAGVPVIHRLHVFSPRGWIVLGDNNDSLDREVVTETNLLGRVCAIFYTTPGAESLTSTALAQR